MTTWNEMQWRSDFDVELVNHCAYDTDVVRAARVSTVGKNEPDEDAPGLIKYLMEARHGSPFEHNMMTFYVAAPIFVFREFMRHRIASYNEESARYSQLRPIFYVPGKDRPLVQIGTSARPRLVPGSKQQHEDFTREVKVHCYDSYRTYISALGSGVAREMAREVLPVAIYSSMYVTMNTRALMNFLSLRVKSEGSMFPSNPQWEINRVADQMETIWAYLMPITHAAFVAARRVCP